MIPDYDNSRMEYLIDELIHSEVDRTILKRHFLDGWSYQAIADAVGRDKSTCCRRVNRLQGKLFRHL